MMNQRGHYGSARVGQATIPVYVERMPVPAASAASSSRSPLKWILGAIVLGGGFLWTRHQSKQIERLNSEVGIPNQTFASSLLQGTASSLRSLADRAQPRRKEADK